MSSAVSDGPVRVVLFGKILDGGGRAVILEGIWQFALLITVGLFVLSLIAAVLQPSFVERIPGHTPGTVLELGEFLAPILVVLAVAVLLLASAPIVLPVAMSLLVVLWWPLFGIGVAVTFLVCARRMGAFRAA